MMYYEYLLQDFIKLLDICSGLVLLNICFINKYVKEYSIEVQGMCNIFLIWTGFRTSDFRRHCELTQSSNGMRSVFDMIIINIRHVKLRFCFLPVKMLFKRYSHRFLKVKRHFLCCHYMYLSFCSLFLCPRHILLL